mmetsp:Transcript_117707/g.375144  ORF Transcript_117707/g.375144 Transcript_117707/m.375144 type:complete len:356 (-) Transcript_117707:341-1408(-)|eukprot:CAMPEP_0203903844 /NCGR_PEP_ID=MMETSP0359-20131031/45719_1 /ASSEMBLY_ACC=CAM_ASM_000338 /TAXON_ID=268821 /ORGANISM="Scrippsiella Hangoei, Strain SHTV-5" /LENGTH=355 /DNA_ID=CAMNT_0050827955 /DNA_START=32 /DNA_END=1099 /DNA_ORIENTATION=+
MADPAHLRLDVDSPEHLQAVASKAPNGALVVPELADPDEDPDGWQVMGLSRVRVTATVKQFLEHALFDLTNSIPEEYRTHPNVIAQREDIQALIDGKKPFTVELRDTPCPPGDDQSLESSRFWQDYDGRGSEFIPVAQMSRPCKTIDEQLGLNFHKEPDAQEVVELGEPRSLRRCVIAPGNGCDDIVDSNWYGWLNDELRLSGAIEEVVCRDFPDPLEAKRSIWLPFMRDVLKVGPDTILVGHSSGAEAAMRFAETSPVGGLVLVSACHSDLGDEGERASGYYPPSGGPWDWAAIRKNTGWIVQFHSKDDPLVPVDEGRLVANELRSEYKELDGHSHFFEPFRELLEAILTKVKD